MTSRPLGEAIPNAGARSTQLGAPAGRTQARHGRALCFWRLSSKFLKPPGSYDFIGVGDRPRGGHLLEEGPEEVVVGDLCGQRFVVVLQDVEELLL